VTSSHQKTSKVVVAGSPRAAQGHRTAQADRAGRAIKEKRAALWFHPAARSASPEAPRQWNDFYLRAKAPAAQRKPGANARQNALSANANTKPLCILHALLFNLWRTGIFASLPLSFVLCLLKVKPSFYAGWLTGLKKICQTGAAGMTIVLEKHTGKQNAVILPAHVTFSSYPASPKLRMSTRVCGVHILTVAFVARCNVSDSRRDLHRADDSRLKRRNKENYHSNLMLSVMAR
jgi:hypothetical protein